MYACFCSSGSRSTTLALVLLFSELGIALVFTHTLIDILDKTTTLLGSGGLERAIDHVLRLFLMLVLLLAVQLLNLLHLRRFVEVLVRNDLSLLLDLLHRLTKLLLLTLLGLLDLL